MTVLRSKGNDQQRKDGRNAEHGQRDRSHRLEPRFRLRQNAGGQVFHSSPG